MLFDDRRISEIRPQEITDLIDNPRGEDLWLEFKQEPYKLFRNRDQNGMKQKSEMLKDVASIANAEGGYIIIGIVEDNKIAKEFLNVEDADDFCKSITDLCLQHIDPRIPFLEVEPFKVDWKGNQYTIIIIHIPPSSMRPHFVKWDESAILVRRYGDRKREMLISELVDMLSSRYYPANLDTINSRLDTMQNILMELAGITQENKRNSMSVSENALEQRSVGDLIHLMKLRFQKSFPNIPYYRIFAVPENLNPDLMPLSLKQSNISSILRDPPNIRKNGFGFRGVNSTFSIFEGWSDENDVIQQKLILLRNGFIELRKPLLSEYFQWHKRQVLPDTEEPWLYPYTVCEYPVSFLRLVKSIYSELDIDCKIHIQQEYWHIDEFILVAGHPGSLAFGIFTEDRHKYSSIEPDQPAFIKKTVEPDFIPDQLAYELIRYIYSCFGFDESLIPLFDENHNFTP